MPPGTLLQGISAGRKDGTYLLKVAAAGMLSREGASSSYGYLLSSLLATLGRGERATGGDLWGMRGGFPPSSLSCSLCPFSWRQRALAKPQGRGPLLALKLGLVAFAR